MITPPHWTPRVGWLDLPPDAALCDFGLSPHYRWRMFAFTWLGFGVSVVIEGRKA